MKRGDFHERKRRSEGKTNNYRVFDESGNSLAVLINRDRERKTTLQNYKFCNLHNMMQRINVDSDDWSSNNVINALKGSSRNICKSFVFTCGNKARILSWPFSLFWWLVEFSITGSYLREIYFVGNDSRFHIFSKGSSRVQSWKKHTTFPKF